MCIDFNSRLLNLSPLIIPTLHKQLIEDVKWVLAEHNEDTQFFNLGYVIGITKCYQDSRARVIAKKGKLKEDDYIFQKFEDFKIMQASDHYFMFDANTTKDNAGLTNQDQVMTGQTCLRVVIC